MKLSANVIVLAAILQACVQADAPAKLQATFTKSTPDCTKYPWFWRCFPDKISTALPGDIDQVRLTEICPGLTTGTACAEPTLVQVDHMFQVFGWQLFIAMNSAPSDSPTAELQGASSPRWVTWDSTSSWVVAPFSNACTPVNQKSLPPQAPSGQRPPEDNPIVDQSGHEVAFDALLDAQSFAHATARNSRTKQAYQWCNKQISSGSSCNRDTPFREAVWGFIFDKSNPNPTYADLLDQPISGPIRLKVAMRELTANDDAAKFVTTTRGDKTFGLVAMHLVTKTISTRDRWVWATFEHVAAVDGPAPFFANRKCEADHSCPRANQCSADPATPTQIVREHPLSAEVVALNKEVQKRLGELNSPLQNYQLIGVQWSYPQSNPNTPNGTCYLNGQEPYVARPNILANAVVEWDRQTSDCMSCHREALTYRLPSEQCAGACPKVSGGTACPSAVLGNMVDAFNTGDYFWTYKNARSE